MFRKAVRCAAALLILRAAGIAQVKLPVTGQMATYAAGDDGAIRAGVAWPSPRFVDNLDGTISDNLTGLMWTKDADPVGAVKWPDALGFVAAMNAGQKANSGYTDWRLPNILELNSLFHAGVSSLAQWLGRQGFRHISDFTGQDYAGFYWSASTTNPEYGCFFRMDGAIACTLTWYSLHVWPVRGAGPGTIHLPKTGLTASYAAGDDAALQVGAAWPTPRFSDNGDGTVTDNLTGLMWTRNVTPAGTGFTWQAGLDYVTSINDQKLNGYGDWRMPNRSELGSLFQFLYVFPLPPFTRPSPVSGLWMSTSVDANSAWEWVGDTETVPDSKTQSHGVWPVRDNRVFKLVSIAPTGGGDTGTVSASIYGSGFVDGTKVVLRRAGQPDIGGNPVTFVPGGYTLRATFDLRGKAQGMWDVVVILPGGRSTALPAGFALVAGQGANLWTDIVGPSRIRLLAPQLYAILYGNRGDMDTDAPVLVVSNPDQAQFRMPSEAQYRNLTRILAAGSSGGPQQASPGDFGAAPIQVEVSGGTQAQIDVALVKPTGPFNWDLLANAGPGDSSDPADWTARVAKARARTGETWESLRGGLRSLGNSQDLDPGSFWDFDAFLRYGAALLGSDQTESQGCQPQYGQVTVVPIVQNPNPRRSIVIIHGHGGTCPGDRFHAAATAIANCPGHSDFNIFLVDWSALASGTVGVLPDLWTSAQNIEPAAEAAKDQREALQSQGYFDPAKATFVTESYGGVVATAIAYKMGKMGTKTDALIALNYANRLFVPAQHNGNPVGSLAPKVLFNSSVAVQQDGLFDDQMHYMKSTIRLITPRLMTPWERHTSGFSALFGPCMACDDSWLMGTRQLSSLPFPLFDGQMSAGSCYDSGPLSWLGTPPLPDSLLGAVAPYASLVALVGHSLDPNLKTGSAGACDAHYTALAEPLRYEISFENVATASLAAQRVAIADQLDGTRVDLNSLSLGPITFGATALVPPVGARTYTANVDLRPANNAIVQVTAGLDSGTGMLSWSFVALDPATGQPVTDPAVGFLPPDQNPPEGLGAVVFSVLPKAGVSTGTQIYNTATVVFDANPAVTTAAWLNTIDGTSPVSQVSSAAATTRAGSTFSVTWSGSDAGAGIASYDLFVSDNGSPFTQWLSRTTATSAAYSGAPGHSYSFYSIAHDRVGNTEGAKAAGETTVRSAANACDLHLQGSTGVADVQTMVNEALGMLAAADDLNGDGRVTVADVQVVLNAALLLGCSAM